MSPTDRRQARAIGFTARLYYRQGKHAEAQEHHERSIALANDLNASPLERADHWHDLGNTLAARSQHDRARAAYESALTLVTNQLGPEHPRVARVRYDLASFLREIGEPERARELLEAALATWMDSRGADYIPVGDAHSALANLEQEAGNLDQAESHARQALAIYQRLRGPEHSDLAESHILLGMIHFRRGDWAASRRGYEQAIAIQEKTLGEDHLLTAVTRCNLAEALTALGRHDEAIALAGGVVPVFEESAADHPAILAFPDKVRGLALIGKGQSRAAIAPLERARALLTAHPGYPLERADTQWALARALRASGREPQRAKTLAEEARALYASNRRPNDARAIDTWLTP